MEKTNEVMRQCDRVLATGGTPMVLAAYSSGTPALGVGVGNAVITVDDTADLDDAAEKILISKTLDFAASCSSDNAVILLDAIYDKMLEKLKAKGGFIVEGENKTRLQNAIWKTASISTPRSWPSRRSSSPTMRASRSPRIPRSHRPRDRVRQGPPVLRREDDRDHGALPRQGH